MGRTSSFQSAEHRGPWRPWQRHDRFPSRSHRPFSPHLRKGTDDLERILVQSIEFSCRFNRLTSPPDPLIRVPRHVRRFRLTQPRETLGMSSLQGSEKNVTAFRGADEGTVVFVMCWNDSRFGGNTSDRIPSPSPCRKTAQRQQRPCWHRCRKPKDKGAFIRE